MRSLRLLVATSALFLVLPQAAAAATREYWLAAVPKRWSIVPKGRVDALGMHMRFPGKARFWAVVYRSFTPGFGRELTGDTTGLSGPIIRAEVGDTVIVHFKNLDTRYRQLHSLHTHGLDAAFEDDGSFDSGPKGRVAVGQEVTYTLHATDTSVGFWIYHDHSANLGTSILRGLYGPIVVTRPGEPEPDRRFIVFLHELPAGVTGLPRSFETIDGLAYPGSAPTFRATVGDTVEWDVAAVGSEFHSFHVHDHRWLDGNGRPVDTEGLIAGQMFSARYVEDKVGRWLYHCHVDTHMDGGMVGWYVTTPPIDDTPTRTELAAYQHALSARSGSRWPPGVCLL